MGGVGGGGGQSHVFCVLTYCFSMGSFFVRSRMTVKISIESLEHKFSGLGASAYIEHILKIYKNVNSC
jgi:hypothetical protein